jgi:outer membrane protein assembly factor BamB
MSNILYWEVIMKKKLSIIIIALFIIQVVSINTVTIISSPIRSIDFNSSNISNIDWWTCFHHDAQNTGYSSSETPGEGNLLWTYDTGSPVLSSPAIVDNKVYIGCGGDKRIVCLNATNGNEIWRYHTVGRVYTSPAVDDGRIYIGDDGGIMYCLNAEDGTEIWTYHIIYSQIKSSPTVWDDRLYFGDGGGMIFCLNTKTGRKIWSRLSGYRIESCPAVWQGKVYFGGEDRRMHCFGAHTGRFI